MARRGTFHAIAKQVGAIPQTPSHWCYIIRGQAEDWQCLEQGGIFSKNQSTCTALQCASPWRPCRYCVAQGHREKDAQVIDPAAGLCGFHTAHGIEAHRSHLPIARAIPEPLEVTPLTRLAPKPPKTNPHPNPVPGHGDEPPPVVPERRAEVMAVIAKPKPPQAQEPPDPKGLAGTDGLPPLDGKSPHEIAAIISELRKTMSAAKIAAGYRKDQWWVYGKLSLLKKKGVAAGDDGGAPRKRNNEKKSRRGSRDPARGYTVKIGRAVSRIEQASGALTAIADQIAESRGKLGEAEKLIVDARAKAIATLGGRPSKK